MSKFRANIFLIRTTSNYLWASEVGAVKVDYFDFSCKKIEMLKSSQNKKGQKNFQVHRFRGLFFSCQLQKKTPKMVHLEFFWPFL